MMNNYETPDFWLIPLDYDILTASDNDAPFTDTEEEDDGEQDWGQYY